MDPQLKKCKQCGEEKPLDEYYQSIRAQCKPCCRTQAKIQREAKAEQLRLSVERLSIAPPSYSNEVDKMKYPSDDVIKESTNETAMVKRLEMLEEKVITLETIIGDLAERLANMEKFRENTHELRR